MANRWTIDASRPPEGEKYDWHLPNNDQEHVEETTAPGDLIIKPEDISLVPTKSPTRSGIQSGADDWDYQSSPDTAWYVYGSVIQEDD